MSWSHDFICEKCHRKCKVLWDIHPCDGLPYVVSIGGVCSKAIDKQNPYHSIDYLFMRV